MHINWHYSLPPTYEDYKNLMLNINPSLKDCLTLKNLYYLNLEYYRFTTNYNTDQAKLMLIEINYKEKLLLKNSRWDYWPRAWLIPRKWRYV